MRLSSGPPDPRSIGRENVCSPSQDGCCGVYATRPVPEVSPFLKQPVRHHADFSPRGSAFPPQRENVGAPSFPLERVGLRCRPSILWVTRTLVRGGICFSRSDNKDVGSRVTQENAPPYLR